MIPEWFKMLAMICLTVIMVIFLGGLAFIIFIVGREAVKDYIAERQARRRK